MIWGESRHGWLWPPCVTRAESNGLDYPLPVRGFEPQKQEPGGDGYITSRWPCLSVFSAQAYADVVADRAKAPLVAGASQIMKLAYDPNGASDALAGAQAILENAQRKAKPPTPLVPFGNGIGEVITEAQHPEHGLKTGFGFV